MKLLLKFYPIILFLAFIFSCGITSRISIPLVESFYETPIENSRYPKYMMKVVVTSSSKLFISDLENLEEFKKDHPDYSFLIPDNNEAEFNQKLLETIRKDNYTNTPSIEFESISENEQIIKFTTVGSKSSGTTKYKAHAKDIIPISHTELNLISAFFSLTSAIIGGIVGLFACKVVFDSYLRK